MQSDHGECTADDTMPLSSQPFPICHSKTLTWSLHSPASSPVTISRVTPHHSTGPPPRLSPLAPPPLLSCQGSTPLLPFPDHSFGYTPSGKSAPPLPQLSTAVLVDPAPSTHRPTHYWMPRARPLASGSALARGPASRGDLFSPPRHPPRPQRRPRCSALDAMGLPEERRKSGGGSRAREETGAEGRVRRWSPPPEVRRSAHVSSLQRYRELHRCSVEEPRGEAGPGRLLGAPASRGASGTPRGIYRAP